MLKMIIGRKLDAFERRYGYDVNYVREMLDAGVDTVMAYGALDKMSSYRRDVPVIPYFTAKLVSIRSGDCGPCVQLVVRMAEAAGVDAAVLRAVLQRDVDALPEDAKLAYTFAEATLAHDPSADALRARIVAKWGKRALISLAFAMAAAQVYPVLKYALGHGHACVRVQVGGNDMPVPALTSA